ncbi:glycosyltransferase family 2 protein [Shewanella sp. SW24]|uniref:glycosyltransferase family 2 protein n=1 Tax=Shewanella sp. SW24 TaxID=2912815 RepID=UPI0021D9BEE8|nr:glycosyltransferase family 2 protein [Shewanella sp. SW24]MCU7987574.1 glycosyltransferase family 2 protein [Shewanella sp. SW24]
MILIPMAGLSSRFFKAGYTKPKYMLEAHGKSLFDHSILSFEKYFDNTPFMFVVRDVYGTLDFVRERCECLGIKKFEIVVLDQETRGQAETVALGLDGSDWQGAVTIFNIDTFRPNFIQPKQIDADGYLEVFMGEGDNWSFAKTENLNSDRVIETAEKRPISNLCSTGLYYFSRRELFTKAFELMLEKPQLEWEKGELYVAPLYNFLIKSGADIRCHVINKNEVIFCGVPEEYEQFRK